MAEGAAVAAIGGTILDIEGQRKASRAEAAALRRNAEQKRLEALELLERFEINASAMRAQGEVDVSNQMLSAAARGVDVGSESALDTFEQTRALVAEDIALRKREVDFQVQQLRQGASNDIRYAYDRRKASSYRQLGSFLRGAGSVAGALA
jgi:hypothetical protein